MANKGITRGEYEVTLQYTGLTMDELCKILRLYDEGKLYAERSWGDLRDFNVGKDYERYDDGWEEPTGTYNITITVDQCGGISEEHWDAYTESDVHRAYKEAEEIREVIKNETGIE